MMAMTKRARRRTRPSATVNLVLAAALFLITIVAPGTIMCHASILLSECRKGCMPTCLHVSGATVEACQPACESYCRQVSGRHLPATVAAAATSSNGVPYG
ncbi:hypothetical protein DM860_014219 [Cuscuta australis]|uniref:Uncharacterized protein n=1 Tax=Cuscuta australis TaxID=267555 RepID=A0A328DGN6_9ASTE|nr:hypothetical protein DM860_014219 [Cuscuta australis]